MAVPHSWQAFSFLQFEVQSPNHWTASEVPLFFLITLLLLLLSPWLLFKFINSVKHLTSEILHAVTPCTVGTTHFNEFPWSKMFMIHSVSCFCQLFYPPNPSTPRIIILKILHNFTWDAYLHPSLHDFHMKVRPGQRKRFSSHRTLHHLPSPSLLNFSLYVFSPGTGSRHHHW